MKGVYVTELVAYGPLSLKRHVGSLRNCVISPGDYPRILPLCTSRLLWVTAERALEARATVK